MQATMEHYKPPVRFGLGGVPLGNEFAIVTEKVAAMFHLTYPIPGLACERASLFSSGRRCAGIASYEIHPDL